MLKWRRRPSRSPRSRVHGGAGFPNSGTPCFTAWPAGSWDRGRAQNPDIRGHSRCIVRCANGPSARGRLHRRSVWRPRLWRGQGRVARLADSTLPSKGYAFVWRSSEGLSSGIDFPLGEVLIRLADGAVLAKLGGTYWDTGQMHANRHDLMAA